MGSGRSGRDDVLAAWQSCLDHDPACEEAAGALIRGYLAQGRPELAARVFERCRAALEQLGLRISPSLERVYAAAAREHNVPAASPATAPAAPSAGPAQPSPQSPREAGPFSARPAAAPARGTPARDRAVRRGGRPGRAGAGALGLEALRELVGGSLAAVIAEVEALGGTVTSVSGRGPAGDVRRAGGARGRSGTGRPRGLPRPVRRRRRRRRRGRRRRDRRCGSAWRPARRWWARSAAAPRWSTRAFGDVVSVAAALQSAARPGSVLVGPATRAVTGHLFSWGAAEEVALAADPRPLVASYLDAPRARVGRPAADGSAAGATLVGRDAELRVLDAALRAAVGGRGSVVVLTGERRARQDPPGPGVPQALHRLGRRGQRQAAPLAGGPRCASYASADPLRPVPAAGGQLDRGSAGPAGAPGSGRPWRPRWPT